jgi:hypothetical protein
MALGSHGQHVPKNFRSHLQSGQGVDGISRVAGEVPSNVGIHAESHPQDFLSRSDPADMLHDLIMRRKLQHNAHPMLPWHASNAFL